MTAPKKRPRRNNQGPKVFAKKIKTQEDVNRALEMRKAGLSVRAVAAHLGRSTGWVSEQVKAAIRDLPLENALVYRAHVVAREEAIIASHWTNRAKPEHAKVIQGSDKLLVELLGLAAAKEIMLDVTSSEPTYADAAILAKELFKLAPEAKADREGLADDYHAVDEMSEDESDDET